MSTIQIGNASEWNSTFSAGNFASGSYEITADITFTSQPNVPILIGTLDGGNYTLTFNYSDHKGFVILGWPDQNGSLIQNVKTNQGTNGTIKIGNGSLCSSSNVTRNVTQTCTVKNCSYTGNLINSGSGGIVCRCFLIKYTNLQIENCSMNGNISGEGSGGIIGNYNSVVGLCTISKCSFNGNISGTGSGGITGSFAGSSGTCNINECYSNCNISGQSSGGICGVWAGYAEGTCNISRCYVTGTISGYEAGGICGFGAGRLGTCNITNCFTNFTDISDNQDIGGIVGKYSDNVTITTCYVGGDWTGTNGAFAGPVLHSQGFALYTISGSGYLYKTSGSRQIGDTDTSLSGGTVEDLSTLIGNIGTGWDSSLWATSSQNYPYLSDLSISISILSFDGNGTSISNLPSDITGNFYTEVTLSSTEPTRSGYSFLRWNSQADGEGDDYTTGATYTLSSSETDTLYAQWQINTVTLQYDANEGSGAPTDQTGDAFSEITLSETVPTRDGYSFSSWNTQANGGGDNYASEGTYTLPASGPVTLYAQWQINTVTIQYNANGGSNAPTDQTGDAFSDIILSSTVPTRDGYSFATWNTQANGGGTDYASESTYTLPASGIVTLYAQWQINTVTLQYNANGGSGAPTDQTGDAFSNITLSSSVPTRTGYSFTTWNTQAAGGGDNYVSGGTYTLPASGPVTLYAQWQINTITIQYNANGGSDAPSDQTGDAFSNITLSSTVPTRNGYSFTTWNTQANGGGTDYASESTYTLPASGIVTLYAQWQINTITIQYDANGGSNAPTDQTGDAFSNITLSSSVPTRTGYSFTTWNTQINGEGIDHASGSEYTLPASGPVTLYAQWQINTVTLQYNANSGSGAPTNQTGNALSEITLSTTTPTRDGYSFTSWNTQENGGGDNYVSGGTYTLPASGTVILYAQWQINTITIQYDANGGSGAPTSQTGNAFSSITLSSTVPTKDGFIFTTWNTQINGGGTDHASGSEYTLPASGPITLYAQWNEVQEDIIIIYNANGGSGAPVNQTGSPDSTFTLSSTEPTRDGYSFLNWNTQSNGDGTDYASGSTYNLPSSGIVTLYAEWQVNIVTLQYNLNGGSGTFLDQTGDAFSTITLSSTIPTRNGYSFTTWNTQENGNGSDYVSESNYNLSASGTDILYAQWQINTVTLQYNANCGSGAPSIQTGNAFSEITLSSTIPIKNGYSFTNWNTQADGEGSSDFSGAKYTLSASGTDILYAQWQINTITLQYNANGGSGVPSDKTGDAFSDITLSSTVPTRTGYSFTKWNTQTNGGGTDYASEGTYSLPASGTVTLYAQWEINTITLQYDDNGGSGGPLDQTGSPSSIITLSTNIPTRTNYIFKTWNTSQDGTGNSYNPGDNYTLPSSGTVILYAQWETSPSPSAPEFVKFDVIPGTYESGTIFSIGVTFNQPVLVNTDGGTPYLDLSNKEIAFYSGIVKRNAMSDEIFFSYIVTPFAPSDFLSVLSLKLNGGTITNSEGVDANISNIKGHLIGVIIGDPHITTLSGITYDLNKLGPIRLYDNEKKGSERIIINGYSAHGDDYKKLKRQYLKKFYFVYGDNELIIDSGFRGRRVEVIKNNGFTINEKYLRFSKRAVSYCSGCKEKYNENVMMMLHRLETIKEGNMHNVKSMVRNCIKFILGDNEFLITITNVDRYNLQPCRLSIMPLKKVSGVGCLIDKKYGKNCDLKDLYDKKRINYENIEKQQHQQQQ